MGEVIYGDIKQYIEELANSLGVAAEHVYELLVRQQVISGIVGITVGGLILIAGLAIIFFTIVAMIKAEWVGGTYSKTPSNKYASYLELGDGFVFQLVVALSIVAVIICTFVVSGSIMQLINPEYYAIREIMDVFKGGN